LQVVALQQALRHVGLLGRQRGPDVARKERRRARPEIGEDDAGRLMGGVGDVLEAVLEGAAGRLGRRVEHPAGHVVLPAVVDAAQPTLLVPSVVQRGAPVQAVLFEQADAPLAVAEGD